MKKENPWILVFDTETAPIIAAVWRLFDENVGLSQIQKDWHFLSFSAKWYKSPEGTVYGPNDKIIYMDQRDRKDISDDSRMLKEIWKLLDEADVVITQNGNSFDIKKLYARFVLNGMKPPSKCRNIDTFLIAKRVFGFTSNKLAYMTDKLCTKYKKLEHSNFPGFELWKECLAGNRKAWGEMERYNKWDVLSLEELYTKLIPWDSSIDFSVYSEGFANVCSCGSREHQKRGYHYTATGKFQRYQCEKCGKWTHDRNNLFSKEKRKSLRAGIR